MFYVLKVFQTFALGSAQSFALCCFLSLKLCFGKSSAHKSYVTLTTYSSLTLLRTFSCWFLLQSPSSSHPTLLPHITSLILYAGTSLCHASRTQLFPTNLTQLLHGFLPSSAVPIAHCSTLSHLQHSSASLQRQSDASLAQSSYVSPHKPVAIVPPTMLTKPANTISAANSWLQNSPWNTLSNSWQEPLQPQKLPQAQQGSPISITLQTKSLINDKILITSELSQNQATFPTLRAKKVNTPCHDFKHNTG